MMPPAAHRESADARRRRRRWQWRPHGVIATAIVFAFAAGRWPALPPIFTAALGPIVLLFVATTILANVQLARCACPCRGRRFASRPFDGADLRADAGKACRHCSLPLHG